MRDIRLEEVPFEFDGKRYLLRCNMNVLADVQEAYGGSIGEALDGKNPLKSVTEFLAAMLNDYADEQGWPERWTAKQVGRKLSPRQIPKAEIMSLVTRAIVPPSDDNENVPTADTTENQAGPGNSGN